MAEEFRLDELAQRANVPSTTVRLYRSRGLLAPPRLVGRTGWYGESHLSRLRLIARLQDEGHSLAGIGRLLARWEEGRGLDAVMGVEAELAALLGDAHVAALEASELLGRFPAGAMTPGLLQRAAELRLVEATDDGKVRIADRRFLETGSALAHLGVPLEVVLDEWEALVAHTDQVARRFIKVFDDHLAPSGWRDEVDPDVAGSVATTLTLLQAVARQVIVAALDASVARLAGDRLGQQAARWDGQAGTEPPQPA